MKVKNLKNNIEKGILTKPSWLKVKIPINDHRVKEIKNILNKNDLHSVCREANCPNLYECFSRGTVTFMILGAKCTRRCPFCDVKHGRPQAVDSNEPLKLADTIINMKLNYVVITSVNRDDLHDGGAQHFAQCIIAIHEKNPLIKIEILVPDFRGCMDYALRIFKLTPPDVFNHNIENVPRIYHHVRPGANYRNSLRLLERFKNMHPEIPTKSGLMVGLGETNAEIVQVMTDLRICGVSMLTIGQYLQPSTKHLPVQRYLSMDEFNEMKDQAINLGFVHISSGPLVRSSYNADINIKNI